MILTKEKTSPTYFPEAFSLTIWYWHCQLTTHVANKCWWSWVWILTGCNYWWRKLLGRRRTVFWRPQGKILKFSTVWILKAFIWLVSNSYTCPEPSKDERAFIIKFQDENCHWPMTIHRCFQYHHCVLEISVFYLCAYQQRFLGTYWYPVSPIRPYVCYFYATSRYPWS